MISLMTYNYYLKPLTYSDITEEYIGWLSDPKINRLIEARHSPPSLEEQHKYVDSFNNKDSFIFGLYEKAHDKFIGTFTLRTSLQHRYGILGYMIGDTHHWGSDAGIACCSMGLDFGFFHLELDRIEGGPYSSNISSIFNYNKLGFTLEGTQRKKYNVHGEKTDGLLFGILKEEWITARDKIQHIGIERLSNV